MAFGSGAVRPSATGRPQLERLYELQRTRHSVSIFNQMALLYPVPRRLPMGLQDGVEPRPGARQLRP